MTNTTTKVRNGSIILPKEVRKTWREAEVFISAGEDSIFIKKFRQPSLSQLRPKLEELGRRISKKDIEVAIRQVRVKKK